MTNKEFNLYMNKFKKQYAVIINEDNIRIINGKLGKIAPYDPKKQLLGVWCINLTKRHKNSLLKRLKPILIEVHQNCDNEFGAYFHEKDIDAVCSAIKAKRRRKLTDEQRQKLAQRAKKNFNK